MTPAEIKAAATRVVDRTTKAQNLPMTIEDPQILRAVANVVKNTTSGGDRRGKAA